jgi:WD40-like Beta Propeller Repeat
MPAVRSGVEVRERTSVACRAPAAIAAIAAVLLLLGASPAVATVSGMNGYLAFETAVRPGIAVMNAIVPPVPRGAPPVALRRTPPALARITGGPRDPAWSPSATRLAFTATRAGNQDIYVVARDGTGERRLTFDPAPDSGAAWSPDGGTIAFESARDGDIDIYVMNADGTDPRRLTSASGVDEHPAWSPDGRRISFESARDGNIELYVMGADGSSQTRLTFNQLPDGDPSWSPDGREIAFVAGTPPVTNLFAINPDAGTTRRLTSNGGESPAWSPDGRLIAFNKGRPESSSLYVANAHGPPESHLVALAAPGHNPDWAQLPPPAATIHGITANATPIGKVLIEPPGASAFERLTSPREIPLGTRLDTRVGTVKLTTADQDGHTTTTTASEGIFTLSQTSTSTDLTMPTPRCPRARASTAYHLPPPDRSTLKTSVNGPVRVHGRHTIAAARGTTWTTTLTCARTTVKVTEGTVIVRNRLTRRTGRPVKIRRRVKGRVEVAGKYSAGAAFG